jgi:hypothetical protein
VPNVFVESVDLEHLKENPDAAQQLLLLEFVATVLLVLPAIGLVQVVWCKWMD